MVSKNIDHKPNTSLPAYPDFQSSKDRITHIIIDIYHISKIPLSVQDYNPL